MDYEMVNDNPAEDPASSMQTSQAAALQTGRQSAVFSALARRSKQAADLYLGVLLVLNQEANPARYHMAAHILRELIDNLAKFIDIPQEAAPPNIRSKVNDLWKVWEACRNGAQAADNGLQFERFLTASEAFFGWLAAEGPQRQERNAVLIRALDPSESPLPAQLEKMWAAGWSDLYSQFARIAHLGNPQRFTELLDSLERTLLDALEPRTFEDHDVIDALIAEAEGND